MPNRHFLSRRDQRGFSYVEVLLSVVLLAVLLVPALEALQSGIAGGQGAPLAARQLALRDKMEQVLATPFYDMYKETYRTGGNSATAPTSFSDPEGTPDRRIVVLHRYNASAVPPAWSANDTGLLFVRVYYEADGPANALNTLVGRWW
jgi:type II secretory pathway pseudopilin PulG